ncbi:HNH endonuclease, partial [Alkalilimnicola sp. S0819]|uniref:HNH endonuclease n=1 Tax=Alkalilimnicola sp. S0819 TaxID=2613922 RepID=UPI001D00DD6C
GAVHIVPFSETGNDIPRNGIALSPTFHRLMDRGIIAPGPDYRWHVSKVIDRRIPDNGQLLELEGAELVLPRDQRWHPSPEYLEARVATLL